MTKIVYGVSGEGSGHSSRSREMLTHLRDLGHDLMVVSYDRGYANLKDDFEVFETEGLHIASLDNRVSRVKTFTDNLQRLPKGHKKLQLLRKDVFKKFQPDFVENLKTYQAIDNSAIKARLAELLDDNCALAREFHRKRARLIP